MLIFWKLFWNMTIIKLDLSRNWKLYLIEMLMIKKKKKKKKKKTKKKNKKNRGHQMTGPRCLQRVLMEVN